MQRNRPLAASLAAAVLLLVVGLGVTAVLQQKAQSNFELAEERREQAEESERLARKSAAEADLQATLAREAEREATARAEDVLRLSALQDLDRLREEADLLWPAHPENIDAYARWIGEAEGLVRDLDGHREKREQVRGRARERTAEEALADRRDPPRAAELNAARGRIAELESQLNALVEGPLSDAARVEIGAREEELGQARLLEEQLAAELARPWSWRFDDRSDAWWHAELSRLIAGLETLVDETAGLLGAGASAEHGWGVRRRLEFAETIEARSRSGEAAGMRWAEAAEAIAAHPAYGALALKPQLGLLPLGPDPGSRLWEFAHLQTGEPAVRGADGELVLTDRAGLVFVLIPGGKFWMGAQGTDKDKPNYDPGAAVGALDEGPVHEVTLSAYFLSKYEMTQGQWQHLSGSNPSKYGPRNYNTRWNREGQGWSARHPVEQVTWIECEALMVRLGLALPSEAQWERGARAGTSGVYWTGDDVASLKGAANLADDFAKGGTSWRSYEANFDDGNLVHAAVGSYRPNAFGLHDVHGNVREWCLDGWDSNVYGPGRTTDPVIPPDGSDARVHRGGSFGFGASFARSAYRDNATPGHRLTTLGLRPARGITP